MGRPRTTNHDFPPHFHERRGRYYYGRNDVALGDHLETALERYKALYVPKPTKVKTPRKQPKKCILCGATDKREARARENARAIANVNVRRGKLVRQPCEKCGASPAEKHHDDYKYPLRVRWLCRTCHVEHHRSRSASVAQEIAA